jgi:hypothetical protein
MFKCNKCGKFTARYIYSEKKYECTECGYEEKVVPQIRYCGGCGLPFTYYCDIDPSYCKKCSHSFLD